MTQGIVIERPWTLAGITVLVTVGLMSMILAVFFLVLTERLERFDADHPPAYLLNDITELKERVSKLENQAGQDG